MAKCMRSALVQYFVSVITSLLVAITTCSNTDSHNRLDLISMLPTHYGGTIVVVIVWELDLQLPMLSVPITTPYNIIW